MKNKKTLLIITLALVVLIVIAAVLYTSLADKYKLDQLATEDTEEETFSPSAPTVEVTEPVTPDFTAYTAEGEAVKLSDYFGKPIVLNFWASWCGPCRMEMPHFNEKYGELGADVTFLMVNLTDGYQETKSEAEQYVREGNFDFPVLYDLDANAAAVYQVYSLPTTYFLNKDGKIVAQATGAIDMETLQRGIDMIYP